MKIKMLAKETLEDQMKHLNLITICALALFVVGCGVLSRSAENSRTTQTKRTDLTTDSKKSEPDTPTTDSTSAVTGVAACDEYLAKVEKFLENPKVPQATRDMYKQSLEQNRTAWKQASSTPQGKAGLETSCKMALDAMKPALEQYGK